MKASHGTERGGRLGRARRGAVALASLMFLALPGGCLGPGLVTRDWAPIQVEEGKSKARGWPAAPAAPRIRYIGSLRANLGAKPSGWSRLWNAITGLGGDSEQLVRPLGIALDEADNICLADPGAGAVYFLDDARRRLTRWTRIGDLEFISPVAVAKKGDTLFVADTGRGDVVAFAADGRLLFNITNVLRRPAGLALAGDRLLVADSLLHSVLVFDLQGNLRAEIGERGEGPGQFNFPTHVATDAGGRIYVTDALNGRIQVLDSNLHYLRQIGSMGDGSGHFSRPKGVAVDTAGRVYAVDALFDNVQIFDDQGRFLMDWGTAGSQAGEFWMPAGIAIGRGNRLFVVDSYNRRVEVFQYVGAP